MSDKTPAVIRRKANDTSSADWVVWVLSSPDSGRIDAKLPFFERMTIGRTEGGEVSLKLDDGLLSRKHVSITRQGPDAFIIEDHASTNGTYVDGERIKSVTTTGDALIRIGDTLLLLTLAPTDAFPDDEIMGQSRAVFNLRDEIRRVARSGLSTLVLGETGTGKELIARSLHKQSGRPGNFVPINCSAVPTALAEAHFFGHRKGAFTGADSSGEGHWQEAKNGTLFLDEVGDLPLSLQPKILRALDSGEITPVGATKSELCDVRIVAATNVDLDAEVEAGRFRRDLFARLAGYTIVSPPLRARRADILRLVRHFMQASVPKLDIELQERLVLADWPMNMRELRAAAHRFALLSDKAEIGVEALPPKTRAEAPAEEDAQIPTPTREQLENALQRHQGKIADVADHFGRDRAQIYRWMRRHGISPDAFRDS